MIENRSVFFIKNIEFYHNLDTITFYTTNYQKEIESVDMDEMKCPK